MKTILYHAVLTSQVLENLAEFVIATTLREYKTHLRDVKLSC